MADYQLEKISQRVKFVRKSLKKDQKEFSSGAGIQQSQISEIENEKRNITAAILVALEDAYKINRKWLESGQGEMFLSDIVSEPNPKTSDMITHENYELLKELLRYKDMEIKALKEELAKYVEVKAKANAS